jgi:type IV pilus assembly protein PilE
VPTRRSQRGFTLVEVMIAVAVVGVLSSVALPSFEDQLRKARRADVLISMMQIQSAQERFRTNNTRYGTLADIGVATTSASRHYTLQISAAQAESYEALATASGAQARDASCRFMKLSANGANWVYTSGPEASAANPADANRRCWSL